MSLREVEERSRTISAKYQKRAYHVSQNALSAYERGASVPSIRKLSSLTEIYGRSYAELLQFYGIVAPQRDSELKSGEVDMGGISAQPVGTKKPKTKYIKLFAAINQQSINGIMNIVDQELKGGIERFVLLISSPGGSVFYGLSAYNFLKAIPAEVVTHNFGSVDSIAAVLFCAGNKRYSVPHARFLLHGVVASFEKAAYEEKQLEERLKSLQIDMQNIAGVIAATTGKTEKEIFDAMVERTTLNPEQAREFGLVHEIREELTEPGADLISIVQK